MYLERRCCPLVLAARLTNGGRDACAQRPCRSCACWSTHSLVDSFLKGAGTPGSATGRCWSPIVLVMLAGWAGLAGWARAAALGEREHSESMVPLGSSAM